MEINPDWEIILWYPKYPSKVVTWKTKEQEYELKFVDDYLPQLKDLSIKQNAVDFEEYGFKNDVSEVHKSDYLRLYLLSTMGGVWSDIDIFYFNSINNLVVNKIENENIETFVCLADFGISTAFMMATKENKLFNDLLISSKSVFDPCAYQSIGTCLCNIKYSTMALINAASPAINIGMNAVMAHDGAHIPEIYNGTKPRFTEESIGIHWYAGHQLSGDFLNKTNGGLVNLPDNIIGNILKKYNNENNNIVRN
jgi:hypothetical protein